MGNKTLYLIKHSDIKFDHYYQFVYEIICKVIVKCIVPYIVLIVSNVKVILVFLKTKNLLRKRKKSLHLRASTCDFLQAFTCGYYGFANRLSYQNRLFSRSNEGNFS